MNLFSKHPPCLLILLEKPATPRLETLTEQFRASAEQHDKFYGTLALINNYGTLEFENPALSVRQWLLLHQGQCIRPREIP